MYRVRLVQQKDIDKIFRLIKSGTVTMTTMPKTKIDLKKRIKWSNISAKKTDNITIILVGENYTNDIFIEIKNIINPKTLLIVNTDLMHCGRDFNITCPFNHHEINKKTITHQLNFYEIQDKNFKEIF